MRSHTALRYITAGVLLLNAAAIVAPAAPALEDGQKFNDWSARCETPKALTGNAVTSSSGLVTKKDGDSLPVLHVLVGYITAGDKPGLFAFP